MPKVELVDNQKHCEQCSGFGEVCERCAFPEDECFCANHELSFKPEQCLICDGSGIVETEA